MESSPHVLILAAAAIGMVLTVLVARAGRYLCEQHMYRACQRALEDEELLLRLLLRRGPDAAPGTREAFLTALRSAARRTRALEGARREAAERRQAELMFLVSSPSRSAAHGP